MECQVSEYKEVFMLFDKDQASISSIFTQKREELISVQKKSWFVETLLKTSVIATIKKFSLNIKKYRRENSNWIIGKLFTGGVDSNIKCARIFFRVFSFSMF